MRTSVSLSDQAVQRLQARDAGTSIPLAIVQAVRAHYDEIRANPDHPAPKVDDLGFRVPAAAQTRPPVRAMSVALHPTDHHALHQLADRAGLSVSRLIDRALTR